MTQIKSIQDQRRTEINKLKVERDRLLEEVKKQRLDETNEDVLTKWDVLGYRLSNLSVTHDGEEKIYNAVCNEPPYQFRLSVSVNNEEFKLVDLAIAKDSVLLEIESILNTVQEECCPHLLLMTIQQFIHLNKFRMTVLQKLTSTAQGVFEVRAPNLLMRNDEHRFYTINVYPKQTNTILEIRWYIKWDAAYQALVHIFAIPALESSSYDSWRSSLRVLSQPAVPFTYAKHYILKDWWDDFFNVIARV